MKKLFLFLALLLVCGNAWALHPDRALSIELAGNTLVKSSSGEIYSIHVTYISAVAGDYIRFIDGTTSSGTVRYTCVASATSGVCDVPLYVSSYFGTGILYTEQKSTGATFKTYIQYF